MNQSLIINDDAHFDETYKAWSFTALLGGQRLTVIMSKATDPELTIDQSLKFDWESCLEEWIEEHEIDEATIYL